MAGNLPPGVTVGMIPGNRPEDEAWEAAIDWAIAKFDDEKLSLDELRRAILIGVAAVKAEREAVEEYVKERIADEFLVRDMEKQGV